MDSSGRVRSLRRIGYGSGRPKHSLVERLSAGDRARYWIRKSDLAESGWQCLRPRSAKEKRYGGESVRDLEAARSGDDRAEYDARWLHRDRHEFEVLIISKKRYSSQRRDV